MPRIGKAFVGYLITFVCYGRHLHGHELGSVDREHNLRVLDPDPGKLRSGTWWTNKVIHQAVFEARVP